MSDDLAYDGSNAPQSRDLTARERDILCRILEGFRWEVMHHADTKTVGDGLVEIPGSVLDDPRLRWMRCSTPELTMLFDLPDVLTPRRFEDGEPV